MYVNIRVLSSKDANRNNVEDGRICSCRVLKVKRANESRRFFNCGSRNRGGDKVDLLLGSPPLRTNVLSTGINIDLCSERHQLRDTTLPRRQVLEA